MFTDPKLGNANWSSNAHRYLWGIAEGSNGNLSLSMAFASNETRLTFIGTMVSQSGVVKTYCHPLQG